VGDLHVDGPGRPPDEDEVPDFFRGQCGFLHALPRVRWQLLLLREAEGSPGEDGEYADWLRNFLTTALRFGDFNCHTLYL